MQNQSVDLHHQLAQAQLPSMPQILVQLLDLCDRDEASLAELGGLVNKDAAITARVIAIANSAYYRRSQLLDGLDQCLAVLGSEAVRGVVLNQSIQELFGRFRGGAGFDLRPFWLHALRCAVFAKRLAKHVNYANADEAYLAGLLHDVGQLALIAVASDRYLPMLKAHVDESDLLQAEQAAFGLNHAEIGAWLAERWRMHPLFVDGLRYHHEPRERIRHAHPLARIVALANQFSTVPGEAEAEALATAWGLSPGAGLSLMTGAEEAVRLIAEQFGIVLPDNDPEQAQTEVRQATEKLVDAMSDRLLASHAFPATACDADPEFARLMLAQSTRLIFGACSVALFTPESGCLRGEGLDADGHRLVELEIALDDPDSGIARAWRGESAALPNGTAASLVDAQVRRLMRAAVLMPLRLGEAGQSVGVLVLGIDAESAGALKGRTRLLPVFAREAARFLSQSRRRWERLDQVRDATAQAYVAHARKIVHEAGNPLSVVRNYLSILKNQVAGQDRQQQDIALLEDELRRVGRILEGLKQPIAACDAVKAVTAVDVGVLINAVLRFCGPGKTEPLGIVLESSLEPNLPRVRGDADKLKQILINLIFNAAEVLPQGGQIRIGASAWRDAQGVASVEIEVADNGPGLPAEVLDRLYQPVQTRKGDGHSGLGLSIVKGLVDALNGRLQCRSGSGGTTFKMVFPAADG